MGWGSQERLVPRGRICPSIDTMFTFVPALVSSRCRVIVLWLTDPNSFTVAREIGGAVLLASKVTVDVLGAIAVFPEDLEAPGRPP